MTGFQPIALVESDTKERHLSLPNPLNVTLTSVKIRYHFESLHFPPGTAAPDGLQIIWTAASQAQGRLFVSLRRLSPDWRVKTGREKNTTPEVEHANVTSGVSHHLCAHHHLLRHPLNMSGGAGGCGCGARGVGERCPPG